MSSVSAVIGSIESMACLNHQNVLNVLSVQQLVDCTVDLGNMGCQGGYFRVCKLKRLGNSSLKVLTLISVYSRLKPAYDYLVSSGVQTNASYPYAQRVGALNLLALTI